MGYTGEVSVDRCVGVDVVVGMDCGCLSDITVHVRVASVMGPCWLDGHVLGGSARVWLWYLCCRDDHHVFKWYGI